MYRLFQVRLEVLVLLTHTGKWGAYIFYISKRQSVPIEIWEKTKIISALKTTDAKIFANQEVVNLIKALGLEIDPKTNKLIYNENKLRYGKILLCMDADPDGQAIKNLILTLLWYLCPELVLNGHVYCAIPPLFRITTKKNEYIFLRDAAALEQYKASHNGEKFQINRNKG